MRILLAAPDRDLLTCYREILAVPFGEVVTAFDGTQVLSLLQTESFDLVLLDSDIPRVSRKGLFRRIREKKIPVIEMTAGRNLPGDPAPDAVLTYPFTPEEICAAVSSQLQMTAQDAGEEASDE